jgi:peroxiredoxin
MEMDFNAEPIGNHCSILEGKQSMYLLKMTMTLFGIVALLVGGFAQSAQITLKSIEGKTFDLAESEGRFVLMYFDGTWSPMADKAIPGLQQLSDLYAGRNVDFYWVSLNSGTPGEKNYATDNDLRVFAKEMRLSVPVLHDSDRTVFRSLKLDVIPTIVIFDPEGKVYCRIEGFNPEIPDRFSHVSRILHVLLK